MRVSRYFLFGLASLATACGRDLEDGGGALTASTDAGGGLVAEIFQKTFPWLSVKAGPIPRVEANGVLIAGKVALFGGFTTSDARATRLVDLYDPRADTWKPLAAMPEAVTHVTPAYDGTTVWFVGGFVGNHPGPVTRKVWKYNAVTNVWSRGPDLPGERGSGSLALVGRRIHFFGGFLSDRNTNSPDHWSLDVDDSAATWQAEIPMPDARGQMGTAVLDGKIFAIGGQYFHDRGPKEFSRVDVYDTVTGAWSQVAPLTFPRSHIEPGTFVRDGKIVIVGGRSLPRGLKALKEVTEYDPATDAWRELEPLPAPLLAPAALPVGSRLYVTGGGLNSYASPQVTTRYRPLVGLSTAQAEAAEGKGTAIGTEATGFRGTGYLDFVLKTGGTLNFPHTAAKAGQATVIVRYALPGSTAGALRVAVNGGIVSSRKSFPATGGASTWSTVKLNIPLKEGTNRIRLESVGGVTPVLDELSVSPF